MPWVPEENGTFGFDPVHGDATRLPPVFPPEVPPAVLFWPDPFPEEPLEPPDPPIVVLPVPPVPLPVVSVAFVLPEFMVPADAVLAVVVALWPVWFSVAELEL